MKQPVAELLEVVLGELLHLVGGVLALEGVDRPALDGLREDDGRLADVLGRRLERGVDLAVVVAAAGQLAQVVVAEVLDHGAQPRVAAEELLADVGAGLDRERLELAVGCRVHLVDQHAVDVLGEQVVPLAAPDDLEDVPAGAAERRLELLDDLAVAAHRAVELLQVAVDDERQVVELLAGGDADRAERLRLTHLPVAEERPDVLLAGVLDAAVVQVAVEARLVDRVDRGQAHRDRRELPELRHQPRMRVRREAGVRAARHLLAERVELVLGQPALEERAGVDAGRAVALEVDVVAAAGVVLAAEEVVEADLVEAGRRLVGGDVAADLEALAVGPRHHDGGVPADEGADPSLDVLVTGEPGLALRRDRVDVVGAAQRRHADVVLAGPLEQLEHDVAGARACPSPRAARRATRATPVSPRGRCPAAESADPRGSRSGGHLRLPRHLSSSGAVGSTAAVLVCDSDGFPSIVPPTSRWASGSPYGDPERPTRPRGPEPGLSLRRDLHLCAVSRWTTPQDRQQAGHDGSGGNA